MSKTPVDNAPAKIFVNRNHQPMRFFVDAGGDIDSNTRRTSLRKIQRRGGEIVHSPAEAQYIIVWDDTSDGQLYARTWSADGKIVLTLEWVNLCLREDRFLGALSAYGGCRVGITDGDIQPLARDAAMFEEDEEPVSSSQNGAQQPRTDIQSRMVPVPGLLPQRSLDPPATHYIPAPQGNPSMNAPTPVHPNASSSWPGTNVPTASGSSFQPQMQYNGPVPAVAPLAQPASHPPPSQAALPPVTPEIKALIDTLYFQAKQSGSGDRQAAPSYGNTQFAALQNQYAPPTATHHPVHPQYALPVPAQAMQYLPSHTSMAPQSSYAPNNGSLPGHPSREASAASGRASQSHAPPFIPQRSPLPVSNQGSPVYTQPAQPMTHTNSSSVMAQRTSPRDGPASQPVYRSPSTAATGMATPGGRGSPQVPPEQSLKRKRAVNSIPVEVLGSSAKIPRLSHERTPNPQQASPVPSRSSQLASSQTFPGSSQGTGTGMSKFFSVDDGNGEVQYGFWVQPEIKDRTKLIRAINRHGGRISHSMSDCNYVLVRTSAGDTGKNKNVELGWKHGRTVLKPSWVDACIAANELVPIDDYAIANPVTPKKRGRQAAVATPTPSRVKPERGDSASTLADNSATPSNRSEARMPAAAQTSNNGWKSAAADVNDSDDE